MLLKICNVISNFFEETYEIVKLKTLIRPSESDKPSKCELLVSMSK